MIPRRRISFFGYLRSVSGSDWGSIATTSEGWSGNSGGYKHVQCCSWLNTRCLAPAAALRLWRLRLSVHNAALFRRCNHLVSSTQPDTERERAVVYYSSSRNKTKYPCYILSAFFPRVRGRTNFPYKIRWMPILPSYFQAMHEVTWETTARASCRPRRRKRIPLRRDR